MGGYMKNPNIHENSKTGHIMGLGRGSTAADNFDKTRKISVLY